MGGTNQCYNDPMDPRELYDAYRGFSVLEYDELPEPARQGWERVAKNVARKLFLAHPENRAALEALVKR